MHSLSPGLLYPFGTPGGPRPVRVPWQDRDRPPGRQPERLQHRRFLASARGEAGPVELHAVPAEEPLALFQEGAVVADAAGRLAAVEGKSRHRSRRLADVPLDGVEAIAAVREVRDAQVLRAREEVLQAPRDERAEGDLEGERAHVDVVVPAARGVE